MAHFLQVLWHFSITQDDGETIVFHVLEALT